MADFSRGSQANSNRSRWTVLPYLYAGQLLNSMLKTVYHSRHGHFQDNFCQRTYFGFTFVHKLCFHPLRIFFDDFSEYTLCSGVSKAGFWRQFLTGFIPAASVSLTLQFFEELKYARSFRLPTPQLLTMLKDCQIGALYGFSRAQPTSYTFFKHKIGLNLSTQQFAVAYFSFLVVFDYLFSNLAHAKSSSVRGNLPVSLVRVAVCWAAFHAQPHLH